MALPARKPVSVEEYLRRERDGPLRHEYVGGEVYAMAGGTGRHNRVATNIVIRLGSAAQARGCRVYVADIKVRVGTVFYYPDVMVVRDTPQPDPYYEDRPCLLIEVLSPSTEATDRREKLLAYRQLESLRTYLIVSPDARLVERHYRDAAGEWWFQPVAGEGTIPLECPALELSLADVYQGL